MKLAHAFCAVLIAVLISKIEGDPVPELPAELNTFDAPIPAVEVQERSNRQRRVTCDLLSPSTLWGSLGHAACAAHCIAMRKGFKGGYCSGKGICICRK